LSLRKRQLSLLLSFLPEKKEEELVIEKSKWLTVTIESKKS
jgi:hypothetical protein